MWQALFQALYTYKLIHSSYQPNGVGFMIPIWQVRHSEAVWPAEVAWRWQDMRIVGAGGGYAI